MTDSKSSSDAPAPDAAEPVTDGTTASSDPGQQITNLATAHVAQHPAAVADPADEHRDDGGAVARPAALLAIPVSGPVVALTLLVHDHLPHVPADRADAALDGAVRQRTGRPLHGRRAEERSSRALRGRRRHHALPVLAGPLRAGCAGVHRAQRPRVLGQPRGRGRGAGVRRGGRRRGGVGARVRPREGRGAFRGVGRDVLCRVRAVLAGVPLRAGVTAGDGGGGAGLGAAGRGDAAGGRDRPRGDAGLRGGDRPSSWRRCAGRCSTCRWTATSPA